MRPYEVIKHRRCIDVAFFVKKVQYKGPDYWKVRGWWINVTGTKPHVIDPQAETISISKVELPNWKVIELPEFGI